MRVIDKLNLIDRIGRELQSRMSYYDIKVYLSEFDIDTKKETSPVNSKWVYVKELLANVPIESVLKIADDLEIEHAFPSPRGLDLTDSKFWIAGHFRLFLSHISKYKIKTMQLQKALRGFGISAFVAHEDIKPTKEWQDEIEKALFSMDALAAILTPGFKASTWTDQEVGVAVGRDVLVVPIRKGLDPYGFIAKYQGLQGEGKTVGDVADSLFQCLANHTKTKSRMSGALVDQILLSTDTDGAIKKLVLLRKIETLPERHLERLRENIPNNEKLYDSDSFVSLTNEMLKERNMQEFTRERSYEEVIIVDDVPF